MRRDEKSETSRDAASTALPPSLQDLQPHKSERWTSRRKAEVVLAVHAGRLDFDRACETYSLTREEFRSWELALDRLGLAGLRADAVQRLKTFRTNRSVRHH